MAKRAATPREVAAASEVIITIVSDPPALEEILWGHEGKDDGALAGLRPGSVYLDSSTISPVMARRISAACSERNVRFLDAPVTGGDWGAREGNLVFMIGGDAKVYDKVKPYFEPMGKKFYYCGGAGMGCATLAQWRNPCQQFATTAARWRFS